MNNAQSPVIFAQVEPQGPSQLIEIGVPAAANGQSKIKIPTIEDLRNDGNEKIIIKGLRLIIPGVASAPATIEGTVAPLSELQKMFLVLYSEDWMKMNLSPLLTFNDVYIEGSQIPFRMNPTKFNNWQNVDWNKSFIQLGNGTVIEGAPYVIMLDVQYIKIATSGANKGQEIVGPS